MQHAIDFNPRSREGSDDSSYPQYITFTRISIHAPAKGATKSADQFVGFSYISIHAPAKGATNCTSITKNDIANFNPRSREGSD